MGVGGEDFHISEFGICNRGDNAIIINPSLSMIQTSN